MFRQNSIRFFLMPYINGPACTLDEGCAEPDFPQGNSGCKCTPAVGGINELYFVPCTETFSEANVTDVSWWQTMINAGTLGRSGAGLGSIGKLSDTKDRTASCRPEQITGITWGLTFGIKCFDLTSADSTALKLNELIDNGTSYLLVARMCEGDDRILPVGIFIANDLDWTVPDNVDENWLAQIVLAWKERGIPRTVVVPGLSAVLPKIR